MKFFPVLLSIWLIALMPISCKKQETNTDSGNTVSVSGTRDQKLPTIVAFGDSLTAGLGLSNTETYPSQLQALLKANGYAYEVVNAGVSGDTTSGGLRRIDWVMDDQVKFVILELGANDILRGTPVTLLVKNLSEMIESIQRRGAVVILAGMEAPTNSGPEYHKEVHEGYRALADKYRVPFIPFFLENVVDKEKLMQDDLSHPNPNGSKILAQTVYEKLKPLLQNH
jgi:acyl-CoA thioesterase-1